MTSFEAFYRAIAEQESGNRYNIKGPQLKSGRAYGKYQVMDFNIGPWTQKYYGRRLTPAQFLASPEAQEAVARGELSRLFKAYGARGAASAWYSGNPNLHMSTRPQGAAGPSIKSYVDSVLNHAKKFEGGGGDTSSYYEWGSMPPSIDREVLASEYGLTDFIVNYYPELKKLFDTAVKESWTPAKFQAKIENSDWWKSRSKTEREWIIFNNSDPASATAKWVNEQHRLNDMLARWGLPNALEGNKKLLDELVWGSIIYGWSDAQVKYFAANGLVLQSEGGLAGDGGQFQMKLAELAYANGVSLDMNWYKDWWKKILQGSGTEEQAMRDIRNRAAAAFAGFKDQILAGQNVLDLASPYIQGMAKILEIAPGDIDLFSTDIKKALNFKDKNGVLGSMPLWKFENDLRKDPRWLQTNNAREGLMTVAHQVARDFGVAY